MARSPPVTCKEKPGSKPKTVMQKKHLIFAGAAAAAFAYFYFVTKTGAAAQSIPVLSYPYNLGHNFGAGNGFSFSAPVTGA